MDRKTLHMIRGYGLLFVAFSLLVGPTMTLAYMHRPQFVSLKMGNDQPMMLSAASIASSVQ
jgi:hypothetical protein